MQCRLLIKRSSFISIFAFSTDTLTQTYQASHKSQSPMSETAPELLAASLQLPELSYCQTPPVIVPMNLLFSFPISQSDPWINKMACGLHVMIDAQPVQLNEYTHSNIAETMHSRATEYMYSRTSENVQCNNIEYSNSNNSEYTHCQN